MVPGNEMDGHLKIHSELKGGVAVITPRGTVDLYSSPRLREVLMKLLKRKTTKIVVNLADVDYMDSSGLATLIEALHLLVKNGGEMRLAAPKQEILFVLELARLDRLFHVDKDVVASIQKLGE